MTFDPYADLIELRDVIAVGESDDGGAARDFLRSMLDDLGYPGADWLSESNELADNEPTVIARRYFVEYCRELADDLGYLDQPGANQWPLNCIDWSHAAKELAYDYSTFTYDGREYLIRSV